MSYTKTTWVNGDTITAEKLNKIENGIEAASGTLVIEVTEGTDANESRTLTMNKTWQEIYNALATGSRVTIVQTDTNYAVQTPVFSARLNVLNNKYAVYYGTESNLTDVYYSDTTSGYPVWTQPAV